MSLHDYNVVCSIHTSELRNIRHSVKFEDINELLHWFAKDEKGSLFINWLLCGQEGKGYPFFLSILLSLKEIGKGVQFQDIRPIREPLQTHLPMTLIMVIVLVG